MGLPDQLDEVLFGSRKVFAFPAAGIHGPVGMLRQGIEINAAVLMDLHIILTDEFPVPLPESEQNAATLANPPRRTNALGYMMGCAFYYLHDHYQEFAEPVLILCAEDDMHFKPDDMLKFYLNCASEDKVFHSYGHAPHKLFGSEAGPEALKNMLTWLDLRA